MRVAINGGGIAGTALAFWLHRGGHQVVLIEKAPQFRTKKGTHLKSHDSEIRMI